MKGFINELISLTDTLEKLRKEMNRIASQLPEYPAVLSLHGVGTTLGPQLIAEIGDVRRFHNRKALIAYAASIHHHINLVPLTLKAVEFPNEDPLHYEKLCLL